MEIGCGNGLFLSTISQKYPDEVFVGLEIKHKCIARALKKCNSLAGQGLVRDENIVLINGDAFTALDVFFDKESFDNIYINFPDPWFKPRHLKKRVVAPDTVAGYAALLKHGGHLYFVTDNEAYRDFGVDCLAQCSLLQPIFDPPYYVGTLDWYPQSLYEQKWREAGRSINYSGFVKL